MSLGYAPRATDRKEHTHNGPASVYRSGFGRKIALVQAVMSSRLQEGRVERRRHPRYGFQVDVDYRNVDMVFSAITDNVSKGGCFIQTDSPLPKGTRIWLEFSFTNIPVKLGNIQGRVAWSTPAGDPRPGMGIEYENVPDVVEELMDEFIEYVKGTESVPSGP